MDEVWNRRRRGAFAPNRDGEHEGEAPPTWAFELAGELDELRFQLTALHQSLYEEVRTRRVVVEEPDGFERVVLEGREIFGGVEVRSRSGDGQKSSAGLFALDPGEGDPAQVGLCLSDQGNIVASLDVYSRHTPRLWMGDEPHTDS
jgi:hypothetical protein